MFQSKSLFGSYVILSQVQTQCLQQVSFSPALGITVPAMDLMCGKYTSTDCSPQKWFDLMGDSEIPYVPFQINYIPHESRKVSSKSKFTPLNPDVTPCHAAVDVSEVS